MPAQRRQEGHDGGRLDHARAERVGDRDVASPCRFDEACHAERGVTAQLERIAETVVEPSEDDIDRLKAFLKTQIGVDPPEVDAALSRSLEEFSEGEHFADDRTLLMLRRIP